MTRHFSLRTARPSSLIRRRPTTTKPAALPSATGMQRFINGRESWLGVPLRMWLSLIRLGSRLTPRPIRIYIGCPIIRRDWPAPPAPPTDGFDNADALKGLAKLAANDRTANINPDRS